MADNRISVVVCTRNRAEVFERCLRSIVGTKPGPLEVVVVDQSDDGRTARLVEDLSRISPFPVHYLHMDGTGLSRARNAAIRICSGEIVAFTDDDCVVREDWLDDLDREFSREDISCVCGQTRPANHRDRPKPALLSTLNHSQRRFVRGKHNPINIGRGNNMAFRRLDLIKLGGFHERVGVGADICAGEDTDVFYRLLSVGGTIVHAPNAFVMHAQPDDLGHVARKKREYSMSAAAVLSSRLRYGDVYAGLLLSGKMLYEFGGLFCAGVLRMNRHVAAVGWHSFTGSVSGLKYLLDKPFCREVHRLDRMARMAFANPELVDPGAADRKARFRGDARRP